MKKIYNFSMLNSLSKSDRKIIIIISCSAVIFMVCTVLMAIWAILRINTLEQENSSLNETRLILITKLKENNAEILSLKNHLQPTTDLNATNKLAENKETIQFSGTDEYVKKIKGIPVSVSNGAINRKIVSLTFDGSSLANTADDILDTLKSRHIKATIFVTGTFIQHFPGTIKRILAEGHEIGNHTYSHPHLTTYEQNKKQITLPEINPNLIREELFKADSALFHLTGQHFAGLWRAPYGEFNATVCSWALNAGYIQIGWRQGKSWAQSLDSFDWIPEDGTPGYKSPHEVLIKILSMADTNPYGINGGIILMHLGTTRKQKDKQVFTVLGDIIDSLQSRGYELVPVSEMLKFSDIRVPAVPDVQAVSLKKE